MTLTNSTLSGNSADNDGGGIYNDSGGTVTLTNSTLSSNSAPNNGGGGIFNSGGTVALTNSTLSSNSADNGGGGIFNDSGGTVTLTNTTLSGNSAPNSVGGGIVNIVGTVTLTNSTLSGNSAGIQGGGIVNAGTVTLNRTIVTGNTAPSGSEIYSFNTSVSGNNHNVLGHNGLTNAQAFNNFAPGGTDVNATSDGTNPTLLASILNTTLATNGGPTSTHALVSGSPAIDVAPTAACENGVLTSIDQRGAARNVNGNGVGSANECDAGAVEHNSSQIPTELRFVGNCSGADLSGDQMFGFAGGTVNIDVTNANGLKCISIGHFASDHPNATGSPGNPGIATGQWWRINGNIDSGFTVDVTLPHNVTPDSNAHVCRWLDGTGPGFGWECGRTNATASTVTWNARGNFSDWAVGDEVGPTAVSNLHTQTTPPATTSLLPLLLTTLLATLTSAYLWVRRPRRSTF